MVLVARLVCEIQGGRGVGTAKNCRVGRCADGTDSKSQRYGSGCQQSANSSVEKVVR